MGKLEYSKGVDTEHEVKLDSSLVSSVWLAGMAYTGQKVKFRVQTAFVGNGAKIKVTGKSANGKKLGKVDGVVIGNVFAGKFEVPEDIEKGDEIYYEVKLSANGLDGESETIPVFPAPGIKSMKWSADEARRGDILTLSAELKNVQDNADVIVTIYEHDQDGAHDKIVEIPSTLENKKLELKWEYEYHEDTDEIPTEAEVEQYGGSYNPPEYFYTIKLDEFELGKDQESGILTFKDYIEINLSDEVGNPIADEEYVLHLPDGSEKRGNLDGEGYAKEEGIPPGNVMVEFPNQEQINSDDEDDEEQ